MASLTGVVKLEEGLTEDEKVRSLVCAAEVEAVLQKHGCKIVTTPIVNGNEVWAEIHVLPAQPRRL